MRDFRFIAVSLPGIADAAIARAAIAAGEIGVINGEGASSAHVLRAALESLRGCPRERCGVRLDLGDAAMASAVLTDLPEHLGWVLLASAEPESIRACVPDLKLLGVKVLIEATDVELAEAAATAGADGIIAKGNEAGGWVAEETTFMLLQRLRRAVSLPIWAHGGIGSHTVAAAAAGGAAGAVLDAPLALLRESMLPDEVKKRLAQVDGTETVCLGAELDRRYRGMAHPRSDIVRSLSEFAAGGHTPEQWREEIRRFTGWGDAKTSLWPLGQDVGFARRLAERYVTVGRALRGLRAELRSHLRSVRRVDVLTEGSAWATAHSTRYPIAQGPMTRVSDTPAFAQAVVEAGGLPFLALAMQRETEIDRMMSETRQLLGNRSWGVGLLGFLEKPLLEEQLNVVRRCRPPFALIAGGQPEQARLLEKDGIGTYLHVPTPGLLKLFLDEGVRRFVFEGRECGGHIGPLSSFVLWEQAADVLLHSVPANDLSSCHVILAGGIHDAQSAAMAAVSMASLAERGVKIGFLMGTAYLFTKEAVSSGAILETFQRQALACRRTVLLETGAGYVVRCAPTPYTEVFAAEKARLSAEGASAEEIRTVLETMHIGRLRLAAKGLTRRHGAADTLTAVDENGQTAEGLYMIGQAAALREEVRTVEELHRDVSVGGSAILQGDASHPASQQEGIAIVGMSCLLPGANNLDAFWTNILNKVDAIREVPPTRWDWRLYYNDRRETPDRVYARWGGFLDPVTFDPASYGMPPSSLASIEPIQLLALEVARAALRDAGYEDRSFPRENTSVIIGVSGGLAELGQNYVIRSALAARPDHPSLEGLPEWTEDSFAGILLNVIAGRIANRFDLGGPSFAVDAACASSLAAVYLACRELESGASDMSLVGGCDTLQSPFNYLCFAKTQALSPRGRCRTFDHTADGTCISEGLSMLVLKRLEDAERDGDRIYAVIRSVGASSDGRAKGMTAPSPEGQVRALRRAYATAGFPAATVGLIEAHGTGTVAGDRAEIESLRRMFEESGASPRTVALGSVKSMIGHTKGAAGVTGLLKVAMALRHKVLPPTIGVEKPNDSLAGGALYANTDTRPWIGSPVGQPRRAAVSAFGFGGANYHAVVEEYADETPQSASSQWPAELCLWREASVAGVLQRLAELHESLKAGAKPALKDLSFTLWRQARQSTEGVTLSIVAISLDDLSAKIETLLAKAAPTWDGDAGIFLTQRPLGQTGGVAFLFPGQGSQYPDMLRELAVHFHEVREAFEAADRVLASRFDRPLSSLVFPPPRFSEEEEREAREALTATNVAQPALGATAAGLLDLLGALGVTPDMTAGHSYGEYAALCAAGCLAPEQLYALSEARGRFIVEEARGDLGTMAAVEADEQMTRALVAGVPDIWIANLNSPRQTIVSGTKAAVAEALKRLEAHDVAAQAIPVACAFHSPLVAPAKDRLKQVLDSLRFEAPKARIFSNATGAEHLADPAAIQAAMGEHLVSPVRFVSEIEAMYTAGARVFVEVGPRSVLTGLADQILADRERMIIPVETRKRSGLPGLLHAVAQLAAHGVPVNLDRLYEGREPREHDLQQLVAETREKAPPSTAWWVDGGRASPVHGEAAINRPNPSRDPDRRKVETMAQSPNTAAMLNTHEQVMQRLLDTHRRVMLAALGSADAVESAQVKTPKPAPVDAAKPEAKKADKAPAQTAPSPQIDRDHVQREVLRVFGERTGYPPEVLELDADLEADLSIDSIKRVEISGRLRKVFPQLGSTAESSKVGNLSSLRTLREFIERIESVTTAPGAAATPPPTPVATRPEPQADVHVPRFVMRLEDAPAVAPTVDLPRDATFLITDDGKGLAQAVAELIRAGGGRAVLLSGAEDSYPYNKPEGRVAGIIHLLPLAPVRAAEEMDLGAWRHALQQRVKGLFYLAQAAADDLRSDTGARGIRLLAAVDATHSFPGDGGLAGLVNSLTAEWPALSGRVLALDAAAPIADLAKAIVDELRCGDGERFINLQNGRRQRIRIESAELDRSVGERMHIERDWVILATGGARGITAQAVMELAERHQPTLVLVGRSAAADSEESSATVAAVRAAGARVHYWQADVRDEDAFTRILDRVRSEFGRLDGILHAAGVIEDRRIEKKTPESFDRVFDTKADSSFILARHPLVKDVKFVVFFSSIAYLGNTGQSDYAAANGVMNALARNLDGRIAGRVVAVMWGPWQSGMASEEVQQQFRERGVQVIPLAAGRKRLLEEILYGRKGEVEVILGDAPYGGSPANAPTRALPLIGSAEAVVHFNGSLQVDHVLDPAKHAYLNDHVLDGKPVFPAAVAMELMAEAAWAASSGAGSTFEIAALDVQHGIVLDQATRPLHVIGERTSSASGAAFRMQIQSQDGRGRAHYRALVTVGAHASPPPFDLHAFAALPPFPMSAAEAYERWLFQGPCFAGIKSIEGILETGIVGHLQSVPPATCVPAEAGSRWLLDPTVLDASLQLVILWARHWHDVTPLPVHVGRFRLFSPLDEGPVRCVVVAAMSDEDESLTADLYYTDARGRPLAVLEGLLCACTKGLNRLSAPAARQVAPIGADGGQELSR